MSWVPLQVHSHYSVLRALPQPEKIVARCQELGYSACALTDYHVLSGCPTFMREAKDQGIKPILGVTLNTDGGTLTLLAKNLSGWSRLIDLTTKAFASQPAGATPKLPLEEIRTDGHLFVLAGGFNSQIANLLFTNLSAVYQSNYEECRQLVVQQWEDLARKQLLQYRSQFGEDLFVSIQMTTKDAVPSTLITAKILRKVAGDIGVHCVATSPTHYLEKEDATDHRVIVTCGLETSLPEVPRKIATTGRFDLIPFFKSNQFHLPSQREIEALHTPAEVLASRAIAEACEDYSLFRKPLLPAFPCPRGFNPDTYLRERCKHGWKTKIVSKIPPSQHQVYGDRVKRELGIFQPAGLSSYFLIVDDICRYSRETLKCIQSKGRGSAAGCLVSHLLDITDIDPVRYDLIVERFYNEGRNTDDHVALPDIDVDFPPNKRALVIDYIREKYGEEYVSQMATFGRMQGKGAIKDVLRVHGQVSFAESNEITKHIPDPASISDKLQKMEEDTGGSSVILWALEHYAKDLSPWCHIGEDGSFLGPLAKDFEQAVRLEGTKRNIGKHASGIIICSEPVASVCPMIRDNSSGQMMTGVDMRDSELMGLPKFDILGSSILSKIEFAIRVIRTGRI